ncbi:hypothetical protein ABVT39_026639 [Epinephelus coioides]
MDIGKQIQRWIAAIGRTPLGLIKKVKFDRWAELKSQGKEAQHYSWSVAREGRWTCPTGTVLMPDFVCTKDDLALVTDVTIRYELRKTR